MSKKKFYELVRKGWELKQKKQEIETALKAVKMEVLKILKKDGFTRRTEKGITGKIIIKKGTIWQEDVIEEKLKDTPYYDVVFPRVFNPKELQKLIDEGIVIGVNQYKSTKVLTEYVDFSVEKEM
jgi:hypothetical protein